jgi:membrane protease YdiL (CAAX protease family)
VPFTCRPVRNPESCSTSSSKLPAVLFAWLLLRLRRETGADVGLKRPGSWSRAFLITFVIAIIVFSAAYISEKIGLRRDLSQFRAVQGNLELTLYEVAYAFTGAGFYEEFMFRGFLLHGLAMFLGASRGAWVVACILQGLLFGLAHAYQNPLGIAFTGAVGMVLGFLFLACGRNLWPLDHPARAVRRESLCFILKGRRSTEERRGRGKWKKKRLAAAREPFANQ